MAEPKTRLAPDALGPTIAAGDILVEIMATTRGLGFHEALTLTGPYASGATAIFIDQCARLGGQAGIIACVGDDDFGHLNIDRLKRDGADVSAIAISPDYPTGTAFVRYRPDGNRDFVYNIGKSAAGRVSLTAETRALIARAGHLHVTGSSFAIEQVWEIIEHAVKVIKARGGSVSLDPNMRKELMRHGQTLERFRQLIAVTDLLLPSGEELFVASGEDSEAAALKALFAKGVGEVALKRGEAGASAYTADGGVHHAASFAVTEIDPTGAGDCFGGAYVACRRLGLSAAQSLDYACAAGARNVTAQGPMEGAGSRAELDHFIATTGRRAS